MKGVPIPCQKGTIRESESVHHSVKHINLQVFFWTGACPHCRIESLVESCWSICTKHQSWQGFVYPILRVWMDPHVSANTVFSWNQSENLEWWKHEHKLETLMFLFTTTQIALIKTPLDRPNRSPFANHRSSQGHKLTKEPFWMHSITKSQLTSALSQYEILNVVHIDIL